MLIVDKPRKVKTYHFKVLEMKTYPDTNKSNQVRTLFNFYHNIITELKNESEDVIKNSCDRNLDQKLLLSQDTTKLCEIILGKVAILYKRIDVNAKWYTKLPKNTQDTSQLVKWQVENVIRRLP